MNNERTTGCGTRLGLLKEVSIAVVAGLIGSAILYVIGLIASFLGWANLLNVLFVNLPLWTTLLAVLIIAVLVYTARGRRREIYAKSIPRRPRYNVSGGTYHHFDVYWHFLYGSFSLNSEPYAFCEPHPFCPDCKCELESPRKRGIFRRYFWKCERCEKTYKCPENHTFDADEVVEKLVESDIRTGRLRLPES